MSSQSFLFSGSFLSGFGATLSFQMLIPRIYSFSFNVKISFHGSNPAQRNWHLWILIRNPQSSPPSGGFWPRGKGWRAVLPFLTYAEPSASCCGAGGFAGLHAVGGRMHSDKSLPPLAAGQGILAAAKAWGIMKWDQEDGWGSGFAQSLAKSSWSQDSWSPRGLRSPGESGEGSAACFFNYVQKYLQVYKPSYTPIHWLQVKSPWLVINMNQATIYTFSPLRHTPPPQPNTYKWNSI